MMKSVGAHPHVVSLVGCCSGRKPLIVAEYCSRGDLLSYLRLIFDSFFPSLVPVVFAVVMKKINEIIVISRLLSIKKIEIYLHLNGLSSLVV